MKVLLLFLLAAILSACGSTVRLDYVGKHGAYGVGVTLPQSRGFIK